MCINLSAQRQDETKNTKEKLQVVVLLDRSGHNHVADDNLAQWGLIEF